MIYTIRFVRSAAGYLGRLDRPTQERMARTLKAVAEDPYGNGTKPLTGAGRRRAARVGGWRIIYLVDDEAREVRVEVIGPRGEAYRGL